MNTKARAKLAGLIYILISVLIFAAFASTSLAFKERTDEPALRLPPEEEHKISDVVPEQEEIFEHQLDSIEGTYYEEEPIAEAQPELLLINDSAGRATVWALTALGFLTVTVLLIISIRRKRHSKQ